jgi:carboxypeptidase family protein
MTRHIVVIMLLVACVTGSAHAQRQEPTLAMPGAKTIVGVVRDTGGSPIDSAEVYIAALQRRTQTDAQGRFRLGDIDKGTHRVVARHLGFIAVGQDVVVGDSGAVLVYTLPTSIPVLAPVISSSARGGLSGIVGDTAFNVLADAEVRVYGASARGKSDSTGAFHIPLKAGRYMVSISRPGFAPQAMSVRIPDDSGRRVSVWMVPSNIPNRAINYALEGFAQRMLTRNPVWSAVKTREDITKFGSDDVAALATMSAGKRVDASCEANVAGRGKMMLWELRVPDIEMLETYTPKPPRLAPTSISRRTTVRRPRESDCPVTVIVWLRKQP